MQTTSTSNDTLNAVLAKQHKRATPIIKVHKIERDISVGFRTVVCAGRDEAAAELRRLRRRCVGRGPRRVSQSTGRNVWNFDLPSQGPMCVGATEVA